VSRGDDFATPDVTPFWQSIRRLVRQEWRIYTAASVFEVLKLGTIVLYPQLVRAVIDDGIQAGSMDRINFLAVIMAGILVVQVFAAYMGASLFEIASHRVVSRMRYWVLGNLLTQEISFFDSRKPGELTARLTADAGRIGVMMRDLVPNIIHSTLVGTVAGALMIHTSPRLSLVVALAAPTLWVVTARLGAMMRRQSSRAQDSSARTVGTAHEVIAGMLAIRSYHAEQAEMDRYREHTEEWKTDAKGQARLGAVLKSASNFLSDGAILVALWVGGSLIVQNSLTPGAVVTFILYAGLVVGALRNVSQAVAELNRTQGATEEVRRLGERTTRMQLEGGIVPDSIQGDLELEDVYFTYPARPESAALRGVSLRIPRGEVLALVGASGSGKSTIARLLARIYDPDRGRVRLDGYDLRDLDPAWLRRQISLVPAEAALFARTVSENIRFGRRDASSADVERAAQHASAAEFIRELPDGYETDAGDQGRLLSGGQRQRIAIARAVLVEPAILILDEATAGLDAETELLVKESLRKLPQHPTLVIVSHRLSTIVDADRVILVQDGRLAAEGTHAELMQSSQAYLDLVENQLVRDGTSPV